MRSLSIILLLASFGPPSARAQSKSPPLTVATLVEQTLAENPEIKFYEGEILAAKAGLRPAAKLPNPELNLEVGRKSVRGQDASASGLAWAVALAQPIEWPGRILLRKAIANGDVMLAETGLARFRQAVAGKVRSLAFGLALQQEVGSPGTELEFAL